MSHGNTLTLFGLAVLIAGVVAFVGVTAYGSPVEADAETSVAEQAMVASSASMPAPTLDESIWRVLAESSTSPKVVLGDASRLPATVVRVLVEQGVAFITSSDGTSR
jgi:hypothetical protein